MKRKETMIMGIITSTTDNKKSNFKKSKIRPIIKNILGRKLNLNEKRIFLNSDAESAATAIYTLLCCINQDLNTSKN